MHSNSYKQYKEHRSGNKHKANVAEEAKRKAAAKAVKAAKEAQAEAKAAAKAAKSPKPKPKRKDAKLFSKKRRSERMSVVVSRVFVSSALRGCVMRLVIFFCKMTGSENLRGRKRVASRLNMMFEGV